MAIEDGDVFFVYVDNKNILYYRRILQNTVMYRVTKKSFFSTVLVTNIIFDISD